MFNHNSPILLFITGKYMKQKIELSLFVITSIILLISCSSTKTDISNLVIFPAPPDTTRIQFLKSYGTSGDVTGYRSGFERFFMGAETVTPIGKPYGISIAKDKFYLCDSQISGIDVFDFINKEFYVFKPTGFGELRQPLNCFVDETGSLFVADAERKDIIVFDKDLNFIKSIGAGLLQKPTDVCVYKDKIYVADLKAGKIITFSKSDYHFIDSLPNISDAADTAFLHQPTNLTINNDIIYVTDFGEFNIKKYDLQGNFLGNIGSYGKATGQFVRPKGIAVDNSQNLYVVDAGFENVQIFAPDGKLLLFFGGTYKGPGDMYLPAKVTIDYKNNDYFSQFVDKSFNLKYVIFVTNQYGPDKVSVYGFVEPK